jgi:zinc transport system substrate-binding protein
MGISPEEEPSTKDIANVIDLIKKDKLKYIFSEEFVSPKFSQTIKNET